jgi:MATE family multidrug resistance protein
MGLGFFIEVTSFTFMALFLAKLGAATSAGHQIAANVTGVVYMFGLAVGNATAVLTAQAVGAGNFRGARHVGLAGVGIMLAVSASFAVAILFSAHPIASLYTRDQAVLAIAARLVAFVAFFQLFDTAQVVIVNALRGYKIAFIPTLVYTAALWGLGLGGGYALAFGRFAAADAFGLATPMGASGFWLAGVVSVIVAAAILFAYFMHVSGKREAAET